MSDEEEIINELNARFAIDNVQDYIIDWRDVYGKPPEPVFSPDFPLLPDYYQYVLIKRLNKLADENLEDYIYNWEYNFTIDRPTPLFSDGFPYWNEYNDAMAELTVIREINDRYGQDLEGYIEKFNYKHILPPEPVFKKEFPYSVDYKEWKEEEKKEQIVQFLIDKYGEEVKDYLTGFEYRNEKDLAPVFSDNFPHKQMEDRKWIVYDEERDKYGDEIDGYVDDWYYDYNSGWPQIYWIQPDFDEDWEDMRYNRLIEKLKEEKGEGAEQFVKGYHLTRDQDDIVLDMDWKGLAYWRKDRLMEKLIDKWGEAIEDKIVGWSFGDFTEDPIPNYEDGFDDNEEEKFEMREDRIIEKLVEEHGEDIVDEIEGVDYNDDKDDLEVKWTLEHQQNEVIKLLIDKFGEKIDIYFIDWNKDNPLEPDLLDEFAEEWPDLRKERIQEKLIEEKGEGIIDLIKGWSIDEEEQEVTPIYYSAEEIRASIDKREEILQNHRDFYGKRWNSRRHVKGWDLENFLEPKILYTEEYDKTAFEMRKDKIKEDFRKENNIDPDVDIELYIKEWRKGSDGHPEAEFKTEEEINEEAQPQEEVDWDQLRAERLQYLRNFFGEGIDQQIIGWEENNPVEPIFRPEFDWAKARTKVLRQQLMNQYGKSITYKLKDFELFEDETGHKDFRPIYHDAETIQRMEARMKEHEADIADWGGPRALDYIKFWVADDEDIRPRFVDNWNSIWPELRKNRIIENLSVDELNRLTGWNQTENDIQPIFSDPVFMPEPDQPKPITAWALPPVQEEEKVIPDQEQIVKAENRKREIARNMVDLMGQNVLDYISGWDFGDYSQDPQPQFKEGYDPDKLRQEHLTKQYIEEYGEMVKHRIKGWQYNEESQDWDPIGIPEDRVWIKFQMEKIYNTLVLYYKDIREYKNHPESPQPKWVRFQMEKIYNTLVIYYKDIKKYYDDLQFFI